MANEYTISAKFDNTQLRQGVRQISDIIRDGMGHENLRTTQIYLASINSNVVDKANQRIIGRIR